MTHICVGKLTIIGSDNGLSPGRRQAIIWTNAGILLIRTLGTNFSDFLSEIRVFSFKKMHLKMSSGKWRPSCLGLSVLTIVRLNALLCTRQIVLLYHIYDIIFYKFICSPNVAILNLPSKFSSAFSLMKMFEFQLKFHWRLFPRVQSTISQHWFR